MKKKLPLILLISTYACLLITFLILTIVGLDKDYKSNIDFFKPSIEISIGLYGVFYKGDIDVTQLPNFTLNISGIMCVVFAGLSVCSFGSFLYFNKGKYSYIYVAIATAMVLILFAIILSSYPNENNSSDTIGWLFKSNLAPLPEAENDTSLIYTTGGIIMCAISGLFGVSLGGLAALDLVKVFKKEKKI